MKTLKVAIPNPCSQDWNDMLPTENGRFCMECSKEVIDFTSMTDQEVVEYFKINKAKFCGSFRPEQLDHIYVDKRKQFILKSKKLLASLLALLSFKSVSGVEKRNLSTLTQWTQSDKEAPETGTTKITGNRIYGVVTVRDSKLLENIPITIKIAYTDITISPDAQGRYEILLDTDEVKEYTLITFSHPNCKFESRTIHHTRLPSELNIELDRPPSGRIGGVPALYYGR